MKVTALEIRQRAFALRFRGYNPTEVDPFLEFVARQIDDLLQENTGLREALARQEEDIQRICEGENAWRKALLTAQQVNEDLLGRAQQRAQAVLLEAESQAHQVLAEAERTRQAIAQDVRLLTCQKRQLMDGLSNLLSQHLGLLHVQQGQDERRRGNDIPVLVVTTSAAPQTVDDMGHTGRFPGRGLSAMRRLAGVIGLAVVVSLAVIEPSSGDINSIEERARTFFARFVEMSHAFDPAVADFYADEARVVSVRKYPQDAERTLDMRGVEYKPLIRSVMPLAKARGDRNTYTDVLYQRQGERVWIRATRYSALKKYSSPYALLVGPDGARKWLIYEEHGSTRP